MRQIANPGYRFVIIFKKIRNFLIPIFKILNDFNDTEICGSEI